MTTHEHPYPLDRADLIAHLVSEAHGIHPSRYRDMPVGGVLADHETLHQQEERRSGEERREDAAYNHPDHYGGADNPYEAIKVIAAWLGPEGLQAFCIGNAIKYISRAGKKDPTKTAEDLKKARWYLDYTINQLQRCPSCGHPDDSGPPCADMWHARRRAG